ncbi:MAG: type VI secretion system tip protein TssI/VgrG [Desulfatitalea sp.]
MVFFPPANAPRFLFRAGDTELMVVAFRVEERISAPFFAELTLASEKELAFEKIVGKFGLLTMESDTDRYLHGIVRRFTQSGVNGRFLLYQAQLAPQFQLLSLEQDCRIFQNKSVPDIIKEVLEESGILSTMFKFRLMGRYAPREYCVQYRESDLAFISRLLEEEGIFYFFEHRKDNHLLVFGDGTVNYQPIVGKAQVPFTPGGGLVAEQEAVSAFHLSRQIRTGKCTLRDFNFEKPSLDLTADCAEDNQARSEIYDYPGAYSLTPEGQRLAQVRLQRAVMFKDQAEGKSVVPRFIPGFTFTLERGDPPGLNGQYLLTGVLHAGAQPQVLAEKATAESGTHYENEFFAIPATVTIRPEIKTPKPTIEGVQTAIVTGPAGEEIYTDRHGRVKVQFHWDRIGKNDDKSSCWIRVSQLWAGAGWGAMFIPRIGQEVIVDFLEGDPDRPIITGRVYHGENVTPYDLPAQKSKSTIKSNTTSGGSGSNELRFEDKKENEEIYLHGQKNWTIAIENDKNQTIGHDETLNVSNNRTKSVGVDQSETIGKNKTITVGANHDETITKNKSLNVGADHRESIKGNADIVIGGDLTQTIIKGATEKIGASFDLNITQNAKEMVGQNKSIDIGQKFTVHAAGQVHTFSDTQIRLESGGATVVLNQSGDIILSGANISINASGKLILKGTKIFSN